MLPGNNLFKVVIKITELYFFLFLILFTGYRYMLVQPIISWSLFIVLTLAVLAWLIFVFIKKKKIYFPYKAEIYLLLLLSVMVSAAHSIDPALSIIEVSILFVAAFIFLAIYNLVENGYSKTSLINAAMITGAVYIALKIGQVILSIIGRNNTCSKLMQSPNKAASLAGMIAILALGVAIKRSGRARVFPSVLAAGAITIMLLSGSRAGIVAGASGIFMTLVLSKAIKNKWHYGTLAVISIVVIAGTVAILRPAQCQTLGPDPVITGENGAWTRSISFRYDLWDTATEITDKYPLTGSGPGTFYLIAGPKYDYRPGTIHAHNIFYQAAAERGLLGLMATILFIYAVLITIASGKGDRSLAAVGLGVMIAVLIQGLADVTWYEPVVMRYLAAILGLTLSSGGKKYHAEIDQ